VGLAARNSVHSIVLIEHDETVLYAVCAYLNSGSFRAYYQGATGETRMVFPQVHISSVKSMRMPVALLDPQHDLTIRLATLAKNISSVVHLGDAFPTNRQDEAIVREIDSLVEGLFVDTWAASSSHAPVESSPGGRRSIAPAREERSTSRLFGDGLSTEE